MIYYKDNEVIIRNMEPCDVQIITDEEIAQGWHATTEKYEMRLKHQNEEKSTALVAEYNGQVVGEVIFLVFKISPGRI